MAAVPDKHYAGDTLEFVVDVPDYPPSDGWTLKYRFIPRFTTPTQAPIEVIATGNADDQYEVLVGPDATATWVPGAYGWGRWVEKTGARQVLDDLDSMGQLQVLTHPAFAAQGADNRSVARKALDEARQALADMATSDGRVKRYSIAGREMEFHTRADAIVAVRFWEREVQREETELRMATGLESGRTIRTRF